MKKIILCLFVLLLLFTTLNIVKADVDIPFESGGVLRYDKVNSKWIILDDTNHSPVNLYPTILTTTHYIYVYFQNDYNEIWWGYSNPDEMMIRENIDCGARIHLDGMQIWCAKNGIEIPTNEWSVSEQSNIWVYTKGI